MVLITNREFGSFSLVMVAAHDFVFYKKSKDDSQVGTYPLGCAGEDFRTYRIFTSKPPTTIELFGLRSNLISARIVKIQN